MENPAPLWLPRGSVRAIIALMVMATFVYLAVSGAVVPEWLVGVLGMVLGYYFAHRENDAERKAGGH